MIRSIYPYFELTFICDSCLQTITIVFIVIQHICFLVTNFRLKATSHKADVMDILTAKSVVTTHAGEQRYKHQSDR